MFKAVQNSWSIAVALLLLNLTFMNRDRLRIEAVQQWQPAYQALKAAILNPSSLLPQPIVYDEDGCEQPLTKVHLVSASPLIVYMENFISPTERKELVSKADSLYINSLVFGGENSGDVESNIRTSSTAFYNRTDPLIQCLAKRSASLQGFYPQEKIWDIQGTRYQAGQEYQTHYDWDVRDNLPTGRVSTIFGILEATCTSELCGTEFPLMGSAALAQHEQWCEFIDCNSETLVFRAIPGNAVFWSNQLPDGRMDTRTLHAGMPVDKGHKVGINIWAHTKRVIIKEPGEYEYVD